MSDPGRRGTASSVAAETEEVAKAEAREAAVRAAVMEVVVRAAVMEVVARVAARVVVATVAARARATAPTHQRRVRRGPAPLQKIDHIDGFAWPLAILGGTNNWPRIPTRLPFLVTPTAVKFIHLNTFFARGSSHYSTLACSATTS